MAGGWIDSRDAELAPHRIGLRHAARLRLPLKGGK